MNRGIATLAGLLMLAAVAAAGPADDAKDDGRMAWWRDARFGLFIHWGLYAIPAGEWNGATHHGEWIRESAQIPVEKYEEFKPRWNPVKFDADAWAKIAHDAGMRYVVITSKHHDGFCLFDSKQTDWDVMATPFQRDVMKELSDAVRKQGLKMCWYHSIMDWHHPDYLPRRGWEKRSAEGADLDRFVKYLHAQVAELLTNYGEIGVMWFDGEWESTWNHEYGKALYDHCLKLQPSVIVNNRVDVGRAGMAGMTIEGAYCGDFGTPEQEVPARGFPGVDWETCMTMNDHWGYNAKDDHWKSSRQLIRMLVDIASKGGNFLLNVGPKADGTFPEPCVERLAAMGRWMKVNGDAIHGTTASAFASLPFGRCTVKRDGANTHLYLHVFDWPKDGRLVLDGLGSKPASALLLSDPKSQLKVETGETGVTILVPTVMPDEDCSVIDLVIVGSPVIYELPSIEAQADRFVTSIAVSLPTASPAVEVRYTIDGSEPKATSAHATGPVVLLASATVRARAFRDGKPVTAIAERRFEKVAARPATPVSDAKPGLRGRAYSGDWNKLPDFASLPGGSEFEAKTISLAPFAGRERFGVRLDGFLSIDRDDLYRLVLTSDDGSKLWVDGDVVIDHDGLHSVESKEGAVALAKGLHPIRIDYFNKTGNLELDLRIAALGTEVEPIAEARLVHTGAGGPGR